MANEFELKNPLAVVTGASMGIGLELAKQFAQHQYDLIICSESDALFQAESQLKSLGVNVECVQADLSTRDGVHKLRDAIKKDGRPLLAVALNAGVGVGGDFTKTDLNEEMKMIDLNVKSVVHLTKHVLPMMYKQGFGRILYTSSIASVMPGPFEAVYAATKAFVTSFAEAIRNEAADHGVSVTILMPGPTNTNFFDRAHMQDTKAGAEEKFENEPADVARQGFEAMMKGEDAVLAASLKTKMQGWAAEVMPEKMKAKYHRKMTEPGSAKSAH